jgi:putative flippase GtrA
MGLRFLRFNVISALGIGVRLLAVAVLAGGLGMHYLVATAIAIEVSILHNFFWHLHWTWRVSVNHVFFRCVAFHASNGLVSMLGAMVLMPLFVGRLGMHYLVANIVTVCVTGVLNFFCGDRLVFRIRRETR